jgi:hypothetical protein
MSIIKETRICITSAVIFSTLMILAMFLITSRIEAKCNGDNMTAAVSDVQQDANVKEQESSALITK